MTAAEGVTHCDVAVVGAGMVGAVLARALAGAGLRVVVAEASALDWPPPAPAADASPDVRVSAVSVAAERVFRNLGLWPSIAAARACPYDRMVVWDSGGYGRITFDARELPRDHLGHIVENLVIRDAALADLARYDGVAVRTPAALAGFTAGADRAVLDLDSGERIAASLAVAADGAGSRLRELAGIGVSGRAYPQRAVVAAVEPEHHHDHVARQRFLPDGPLALLPLADGRVSIVWSTSPGHAETLVEADESSFLEELTRASERALGDMVAAGPRASFPLFRQHAERYIARRLALIGDAAHTIHPLAGQGANLGFLDAAALTAAIEEGSSAALDAGEPRVLRRYERWRKGHNRAMAAGMEGFHELFGARAPGLGWLRGRGLSLVDRVSPVKRFFMTQAMGLGEDLPPLARPSS